MAKSKDTERSRIAPRWTTMENVAGTLAMMFVEERLRNGGVIEFPSIGVTLTKADLVGPSPDHDQEPTDS